MKEKKFIVAFDFDGTLIKGDSTLLFIFYLRGIIGLFCDFIILIPELIKIIFFSFDKKEIKQLIIKKALESTKYSKKKEILLEKLPNALKKRLRPEAIERLNWHKEKGHKCFIISASPEPLISSISRELGVEIISTRCNKILEESSDHKFKITSPNCNGLEKVKRLQDHLGYKPLPNNLEVYGDSRGDKELLNASNYPHFRSFKKYPRKYKETNYFRFLIVSIASFILFFGLSKIWNLEESQLDSLLLSLKKLVSWTPLIFLILGLSYFARYLRWRVLLGAASIGKFNLSDALWWFRGFALTATPAKIGEITRVHQLNKYLGYPKKNLLSIFFLERIFDFVSVLIWIAILSPNILFIKIKDFNYQIFLFVIFTISLFLVVFLIKKFFFKIKVKFKSLFPNFKIIEIIKVTFLGLLISFFFWGLESLILWILVFVLSPIKINIGRAIYIYLISGIAGILSGLPGGIGVNEGASTIMLQNAGLPGLISFIISLMRRLLTLWTITGLSILSSLSIRKN